jgi:dihydropteroate synthase
MGILNITPDSFYDGGRYRDLTRALERAEDMVNEGATLVDVGGESTRPGAEPVSVQQELDRIIPIIETLVRSFPAPISVDTSKPAVMREALRVGAGMVNDIRALQEPEALDVLSKHQVPVCLMHMQGTPATMQHRPHYKDVVSDIKAFFENRLSVCEAAGISRDRIVIDPGFGFGKTLAQNLLLLKKLHAFHSHRVPLLVGLSRKSMIGKVLGTPVDERLFGSLAAAVIAAWQGARIIRAHDVKATVQALKMCDAFAKAT